MLTWVNRASTLYQNNVIRLGSVKFSELTRQQSKVKPDQDIVDLDGANLAKGTEVTYIGRFISIAGLSHRDFVKVYAPKGGHGHSGMAYFFKETEFQENFSKALNS